MLAVHLFVCLFIHSPIYLFPRFLHLAEILKEEMSPQSPTGSHTRELILWTSGSITAFVELWVYIGPSCGSSTQHQGSSQTFQRRAMEGPLYEHG